MSRKKGPGEKNPKKVYAIYGGVKPVFQKDGSKSWAKDCFLRCYRKYGTINKSAEAANVSPQTVAKWRELDPIFRGWMEVFNEALTEDLEASAHERALGGDTALTIFLLKSRRPKVYRERQQIEMSGYLEGGEREAEDKERQIRVNEFLAKVLENKPTPAIEDKSTVIDADVK